MSSYSRSVATSRGSFVPPLSGIESQPIEDVPEKCDVLISGTGIVESILAAALAWQGTSVLHVDQNPYYGDSSACFNIDQLVNWVGTVNNNRSNTNNIFSHARLYMPRPLESRKYLVDLSPRVMFAKSDLLQLLIKSRVFRYLEFKALGNFHTFENDSFDKVAGSKEDIFTDQSLSLVTKRGLMRFMKFVLTDWESAAVADNDSEEQESSIWKPYENQPIKNFLSEKFKLELQQINELVLSIGLCRNLDVLTPLALARIKRYLLSVDVYGNFPVLFSMYGSTGELSQGFCRSAAVGGATYKLGSNLTHFDYQSKVATFSDGSKVHVSEKVVISPSTNVTTTTTKLSPPPSAIITRMVAFVAKDCKEWFAENEQGAIVVFPPGSLSTNNKSVVQAVVLGSGSGQCPEGQAAWYLSTIEQDPVKAHNDLEEAFTKLETSILRESTEDFEFDGIDESDVSYRPDGMPVLSSVKLGQSMQNFVPREKLQYLLKLSYIQKVSPELDDPVVDLTEEAVANGNETSISSDVILQSPHVLSEISYDGILTQAKNLYIKIVGSDDDFFDVDFEDEDEQLETSSTTKEGPAAATSSNIEAEDDFGHDMEL